MKLPIWTVDNNTQVTVRPGFAEQAVTYAYAGRTRCDQTLRTWFKGSEPKKQDSHWLTVPLRAGRASGMCDNLFPDLFADDYWTIVHNY